MHAAAERWRSLEEAFAANSYDGNGPVVGAGLGSVRPRLVISAPHATNHVRNNTLKFADRGTGGLALLLAEHLGASWVVAGRGRHGDANHQADHPVKTFIAAADPTVVIDLHGMRDRAEHPVAVDLGRGTGLTPENLEAAIAASVPCSSGALFTGGRNPLTVTAWAQQRGIRALQLEIAASWRPPLGHDDQLERLAGALLRGLQAITG